MKKLKIMSAILAVIMTFVLGVDSSLRAALN